MNQFCISIKFQNLFDNISARFKQRELAPTYIDEIVNKLEMMFPNPQISSIVFGRASLFLNAGKLIKVRKG